VDQDLIDKHRHINVDDSYWYECILEDWAVKLRGLGIDTDAKMIQFSGFCSQGDGACFTGDIDLAAFCAAHGMNYPFIALVKDTDLRCKCSITHRDRYYHEYSVSYDLEVESPDMDYCDPENLRDQVLLAAYNHDSLRFDDLEDDIKSTCQGYMREIYRELEAEYDHCMSDEAVWETLVANEMTEEAA